MSIYQNAKADIALLLTAAAAGATVTVGDFDVLGIRPTKVSDNTAYNSKIAVQATPVSVNWTGYKSLFYDRLDLASITKLSYYNQNKPYVGAVSEDLSVYDLLTHLKNSLGATFTTDDLVDTRTVLVGDHIELVLTAKPTSIGWFGTVTVKFDPAPSLQTAFVTDVLSGF